MGMEPRGTGRWKGEGDKQATKTVASGRRRVRASARRREPSPMGLGGSQRVDLAHGEGPGNGDGRGRKMVPAHRQGVVGEEPAKRAQASAAQRCKRRGGWTKRSRSGKTKCRRNCHPTSTTKSRESYKPKTVKRVGIPKAGKRRKASAGSAYGARSHRADGPA